MASPGRHNYGVPLTSRRRKHSRHGKGSGPRSLSYSPRRSPRVEMAVDSTPPDEVESVPALPLIPSPPKAGLASPRAPQSPRVAKYHEAMAAAQMAVDSEAQRDSQRAARLAAQLTACRQMIYELKVQLAEARQQAGIPTTEPDFQVSPPGVGQGGLGGRGLGHVGSSGAIGAPSKHASRVHSRATTPSELQQQVKRLQRELLEQQLLAKRLEQDLQNSQRYAGRLQTQLKTLQNQQASSAQYLSAEASEKVQLTKKVQELESTVTHLQENLTKQQKAVEHSNTVISEHKNTIEMLNNVKYQAECAAINARRDLATANAEIQRLQWRLNNRDALDPSARMLDRFPAISASPPSKATDLKPAGRVPSTVVKPHIVKVASGSGDSATASIATSVSFMPTLDFGAEQYARSPGAHSSPTLFSPILLDEDLNIQPMGVR